MPARSFPLSRERIVLSAAARRCTAFLNGCWTPLFIIGSDARERIVTLSTFGEDEMTGQYPAREIRVRLTRTDREWRAA